MITRELISNKILLILFLNPLLRYPLLANDIFDLDVAVIMNAFLTGSEKPDLRKSMLSEYEITLPDGTKRKIEMGTNLQQVSNAQDNGVKISGNELLEALFSFVKSDVEVNAVLAGYFNKVVQKLYMKNQKKVFFIVVKKSFLTLKGGR